eukprot:gene24216-29286_t
MADSEIHEVEMRLLGIHELLPNEKPCNILLHIKEVGCWVLKLRHSAVIFNNRDLIMTDNIPLDGTLTFLSLQYFKDVMIGTSTLPSSIKSHFAIFDGPATLLKLLETKLHSVADNDHLENASLPIRQTRVVGFGGVQPMKGGWLLKKRDIMGGWKCRYFEVYPGKLVYFSEPFPPPADTPPRGSLPLTSTTTIHAPKSIGIRGARGYSCITIVLKNPDKTIRLASERTGLEGVVETQGWYSTLLRAAAASTSTSTVSNAVASPNKSNQASQSANAASAPAVSSTNNSKKGAAGVDGDMPVVRDSEDKVGVMDVCKYGGGIGVAFSVVHYGYMHRFISLSTYVTCVCILSLVMYLLVQEFLHPLEDVGEDGLGGVKGRGMRRVLSRVIVTSQKYLTSPAKEEEKKKASKAPAAPAPEPTASSTTASGNTASAGASNSNSGNVHINTNIYTSESEGGDAGDDFDEDDMLLES